jgi:hypothetical protein
MNIGELPKLCGHDSEYVRWELAPVNEDGWRCDRCGKLGYRPDLDRKWVEEKCSAVLFWLDLHEFINVSNGTMGEVLAIDAADRCRKEDRYDQYSIVRFILDDPNLAIHADYWAQRATA